MAFYLCQGLTAVILGDGLEENGIYALRYCTLLHEIVIPNAVKRIKLRAFHQCTGLMTVTLGDGLEESGVEAFKECISLERIIIPSAVKMIDGTVCRKLSQS